MASVCAVSMGTPMSKTSFFSPLPLMKPQGPTLTLRRFKVEASATSLKEKAVPALTAAALTASMLVPDVALAAELPPSLKNLLLSVVAGGVVLTAILGAVIAVSNFDPVKRV